MGFRLPEKILLPPQPVLENRLYSGIIGIFGADIDRIVAEAGKHKLQTLVYKELQKELSEPSGEFVRLIASRVQSGRFTAHVKETFEGLIVASASSLIRDRVNERLTNALQGNGAEEPEPEVMEETSDIETTPEEIEGFNIVRPFWHGKVDPSRIVMRDAKSYCAILLDDNNRKSIARLHFNSATAKYFGTFESKDETRHSVAGTLDIYGHEAAILKRIEELGG